MVNNKLTVVAAALRHPVTKEVYSLPPPARHNNLLNNKRRPREEGQVVSYEPPWEQGFLLSDGTFANRKQAAHIAIVSGQIERLQWPPLLYSEDLW